jgi:hypothetical protein
VEKWNSKKTQGAALTVVADTLYGRHHRNVRVQWNPLLPLLDLSENEVFVG